MTYIHAYIPNMTFDVANELSSPQFDISYSTKYSSLNIALWYDAMHGSSK